MESYLESFIKAACKKGWHIARKKEYSLQMPEELATRYLSLPPDYLLFLHTLKECSNAANNAWFLCETDFNCNDASSLRWDSYETLSLDSANGEDDLASSIREFWDIHFPIAQAVHSEFAYLAFSLHAENFGMIVYGFGPEFEESARIVSLSFAEYLDELTNILSGQKDVQSIDESGQIRIRREFSDFL